MKYYSLILMYLQNKISCTADANTHKYQTVFEQMTETQKLQQYSTHTFLKFSAGLTTQPNLFLCYTIHNFHAYNTQ